MRPVSGSGGSATRRMPRPFPRWLSPILPDAAEADSACRLAVRLAGTPAGSHLPSDPGRRYRTWPMCRRHAALIGRVHQPGLHQVLVGRDGHAVAGLVLGMAPMAQHVRDRDLVRARAARRSSARGRHSTTGLSRPCSLRIQPCRFQLGIHSLIPLATYWLSVINSTRQGRFRACRPSITPVSSIRLFVVAGTAPEASVVWPAGRMLEDVGPSSRTRIAATGTVREEAHQVRRRPGMRHDRPCSIGQPSSSGPTREFLMNSDRRFQIEDSNDRRLLTLMGLPIHIESSICHS